MEREVELLSRLSHPAIPRLLDPGRPPPFVGTEYPFFVMEWVEGTPLYAWAQQQSPSGTQLCRVLAQLARALEAVHAAKAVHRDVKGDNVVVRLSNGLPVLIDFGSCHFAGAPQLTWQGLPPVTPEYLSPQAMLFYLRSQHHPDGYYPPSPADDLYALGVTGYRLVTGQYPPLIDAHQDEHGAWQARGIDVRPLLESNPQIEPVLREVIVRLLSFGPEARGTAAQVAEALEAGAGGAERPERSKPPVRARAWKPWLALATAGVCAVLLWRAQTVLAPPGPRSVSTPEASASWAPDAGTAAAGDTSPTETQVFTPPATEKKPLAQEPLPEPRPEQVRPDKRGRCPGSKQVLINGGCWFEVRQTSTEECVENGSVLFKGTCYAPAFVSPKKQQPTSAPAQPR